MRVVLVNRHSLVGRKYERLLSPSFHPLSLFNFPPLTFTLLVSKRETHELKDNWCVGWGRAKKGSWLEASGILVVRWNANVLSSSLFSFLFSSSTEGRKRVHSSGTSVHLKTTEGKEREMTRRRIPLRLLRLLLFSSFFLVSLSLSSNPPHPHPHSSSHPSHSYTHLLLYIPI